MHDTVYSVGDLVRYHPVIGGLPASPVYRVRHVGELPSGVPVAWLVGKTSCVATAALTLIRRATPDDRFAIWTNMMRIRSTNPSQRAHFDAWERLQDLAADQAEALEDVRRLTRELDVALNGEEGAAPQASLCDLVAQVRATHPLQPRVLPWILEAFGPDVLEDKTERADRLLEEVFELLQSSGYPPSRIPHLQHHVFSRPPGEPAQEMGGVMITLAAYCLAHGLDTHAAGEVELARIWRDIDRIREKQQTVKAGIVPKESTNA